MVRWSIMVCSQRVADAMPESGGVGLGHVLRAVERSGRREHGGGWQGEPLEEVTSKRHEVLLEECMASAERVRDGER